MKQPSRVRSRLLGRERSNSQAEKTSGRRVPFTQLIPKLLNTGSQQSRVNLRVRLIHVAEVSRRKHDRFLVESLRWRDGRPLRGEKYRLGQSRGNQMSQQGGAVPTLERRPAKIQIVDLDALLDDVLRQAFEKGFLALQSIERGVDQIHAQNSNRFLLKHIGRIEHIHVQQQVVGRAARLRLKSETHPTMRVVGPREVARRYR